MQLSLSQQQKLHELLGDVEIKFKRSGAYYTSDHVKELDELVGIGACTLTESIEPWGPCMTYVVSELAVM